MEPRADTTTLSFTDGRRNRVQREVRQTLDIRDFIGTPGYSLLVVAANTHLSVSDIDHFLDEQTREHPAAGRSRSWIQRRRWLFQKPGTDNSKGREPDGDRQQSCALVIMAEHPTESVRGLTKLLAEHGIYRSREWVRKHRCTASHSPV